MLDRALKSSEGPFVTASVAKYSFLTPCLFNYATFSASVPFVSIPFQSTTVLSHVLSNIDKFIQLLNYKRYASVMFHYTTSRVLSLRKDKDTKTGRCSSLQDSVMRHESTQRCHVVQSRPRLGTRLLYLSPRYPELDIISRTSLNA